MKIEHCARRCLFLCYLVSIVVSLEEEVIETEGINETDVEDYDNDTVLPTTSVLFREGDQEDGKSQSQTSEKDARPFVPTIPELSPVYAFFACDQ